MKFENYQEEIEKILKKFEEPNLTLEETVKYYEQALQLLDGMKKTLEEVTYKVQTLNEERDA